LACSEMSLALLTRWLASALPRALGSEEPLTVSGLAVYVMSVSIATRVGERMLLGLYSGFGMDSVEELRRHIYVCSLP
jgi:hypothetical protein